MLYLAIDQHAKQLTVVVHNEAGDTVLRRQVSTRPGEDQTVLRTTCRDGRSIYGHSRVLWVQ